MSWLGLDDGILDHPKFIRAVRYGGSEVVHLWVGIRSYCGKHLTDGFIPRDMLDEVKGPANPKKRQHALLTLIKEGLLEEVDGGVQMHDYLDWADSRSEVLRKRALQRDRQRRSRGMSQRDGQRDGLSDRQSESRSPILTIPNHTKDPPVVPQGDATAPSVKQARKKPRCPLPEDWKPQPNHAERSRTLGLSVDIEAEKFREHAKGTGRLMANWDSAFTTWILNAPGFQRQTNGRPPGALEHEDQRAADQRANFARSFGNIGKGRA